MKTFLVWLPLAASALALRLSSFTACTAGLLRLPQARRVYRMLLQPPPTLFPPQALQSQLPRSRRPRLMPRQQLRQNSPKLYYYNDSPTEFNNNHYVEYHHYNFYHSHSDIHHPNHVFLSQQSRFGCCIWIEPPRCDLYHQSTDVTSFTLDPVTGLLTTPQGLQAFIDFESVLAQQQFADAAYLQEIYSDEYFENDSQVTQNQFPPEICTLATAGSDSITCTRTSDVEGLTETSNMFEHCSGDNKLGLTDNLNCDAATLTAVSIKYGA